MDLFERRCDPARSVFAAELRPPQAELAAAEGMDAWIDTYHAVRKLTRQGTFVFLTDSAVGSQEEDNLRISSPTSARRAARAHRAVSDREAFAGLLRVVCGARPPARLSRRSWCSAATSRSARRDPVEHAWQLREMVRRRGNPLILGGWANPHAEPDRQAEYLAASNFNAEFYLTQVVSHHDADRVARFVAATERKGVTLPALFGVFFYRSANPKTLAALESFLPVPTDALAREFAAGATAEDVCAEHDPHADGGRRAAFLHQQLAGRPRADCAVVDSRKSRSHRLTLPDVSKRATRPRRVSPLARLRMAIGRNTRSVNATWGIYIKSLDTNEVAIHPDRQMETMSTIKIPLMVEVFEQIKAGRFALSTSTRWTRRCSTGTGICTHGSRARSSR
jgi:hypothetical protein